MDSLRAQLRWKWNDKTSRYDRRQNSASNISSVIGIIKTEQTRKVENKKKNAPKYQQQQQQEGNKKKITNKTKKQQQKKTRNSERNKKKKAAFSSQVELRKFTAGH